MTRKLKPGDRLVVASHNPGKVWEIEQLIAPHGLAAISAKEFGLAAPDETETTFRGNARIKALGTAQATGLPALGDDSGLQIDVLGGAPGIYTADWAGPDRDFAIAMQRAHDELVALGLWPAPASVAAHHTRDGPGPIVPPPLRGRTGGGESPTSAVGSPPTPSPSPPGGGELSRASGTALAHPRGEPPRANFVSTLCMAWPDGETRYFEGRVDGYLVWPPRGTNGFGYDPMFVADGETLTFGEMEPAKKYAISHRARAFAAFVRDCLAGQS